MPGDGVLCANDGRAVPPYVSSRTSADERGDVMYDCRDWAAWYNRMPGTNEPNVLHVTGVCSLPSSSIRLWLEPGNEGVWDDPQLYVLELKSEVPEVGTDDFVERYEIPPWEGDVGPDVKRVRIQGEADASIDVTIAE